MPERKAPRNRTIDTPLTAGAEYLKRCVTVGQPVDDIEQLRDRTVLGDSFAVLPLLPEACADLIIADPPYNLTKTYNGSVFSKKTAEEYEAYTRRWLMPAARLLRQGGTLYVCCDWETSLIIGRVLGDFLTVRNRITWQREKGRGARANWKNSLEDIWFATKGAGYTFNLNAVKLRRRVIAPYRVDGKPKDWTETDSGNYRDTCPSNFWDDITVPFWSMPENTAHPTQKPEKLIAKLILASSNPGDLVLDPFLGSGTTSVTAKKLGRHYVGIEREAQYCLWCEQRLEAAAQAPEIQGYSGGVFRERNSRPEKRNGAAAQKGKP